jgi:hypothetical protein
VRTAQIVQRRLCTGPKLLVASIAAAAMVMAMVPGTAQASARPRNEPKNAVIPHLLTFGPHHTLIPVRVGMKIGGRTIAGPIGESWLCEAYYNGNACSSFDGNGAAEVVIGVVTLFFTILIWRQGRGDKDDDSGENGGEEGGGDGDDEYWLSQASGEPAWRKSCPTGHSAVSDSCTWIVFDMPDTGLGFENYYYYLKGHHYLLTNTGYKNDARVKFHVEYKGHGGQEKQSWSLQDG